MTTEDRHIGSRVAKKSNDYLIEELDGETVLFRPKEGDTVHVNESGRLIWELCDGNRTVAEISRLLTQAYPESAAQVRSDVENMIQQFKSVGIVDWV